MGIRIINPSGDITEVIRFAAGKGNTIWCWCNMHTHQHNLVFGKRPVTRQKKTETDPHFIIEFSSATFQSLAITGNTALRNFAKQIKKRKAQLFSPQHLRLDAAMHQCIYSITHYEGSEDDKNMYLYARIIDLLWLQQQNYTRTQTPQPVYVKTEYDKERILYARDYLLTHMDAPPTLPELAAIAGINEFKLKRGFKEMFNHTVFGYLADVRLEMARTALKKKQKTVTQIAFELGYASLQHFSAAFKKRFGVSPNRFERN